MGFGAFIDTAIAIVVIVVLFSLVASAIQEAIAQLLNMRGNTLRTGLEQLVRANAPVRAETGEQAGFEDFYRAARIEALVPPGGEGGALSQLLARLRGAQPMPSAISPRRYALAMIELMRSKDERAELVARADAAIGTASGRVVAILDSLAEATESEAAAKKREEALAIGRDLREAVAAISDTVEARIAHYEREFEETMDRVSGWYARKTQTTLFAIGLFLAAGANIDLPGYAGRLMTDEALRAKVAAYAEVLEVDFEAGGEAEQAQTIAVQSLNDIAGDLGELGVPVGWCRPPALPAATGSSAAGSAQDDEGTSALAGGDSGLCGAERVLHVPTAPAVIGWLLIAFATTLGAKFWYELLKALLDMRVSGREDSRTREARRGEDGSGRQGAAG